MTQERMDKKAQQRLVQSVEDVISDVASGTNPTEALTKVAKAQAYTPEVIRRIAEVYNQSKTLNHLKTASVADRSSPFDLADPQAAIEAVYPKTVPMPGEGIKQAQALIDASRQYAFTGVNFNEVLARHEPRHTPNHEPALTKAAAAPVAPPKQMAWEAKREVILAKNAAHDATERFYQLLTEVGTELRGHFASTPFDQIERACHAKAASTEVAAPMAGLLWQMSRAEKFGQRRATEDEIKSANVFDFSRGGFASVEKLVDAAYAFHKAAKAAKTLKEAAARLPATPTLDRPRGPTGPSNTFAKMAAEPGSGTEAGTPGNTLADSPSWSLRTLGGIRESFSGLGANNNYQKELGKAIEQFDDPDFRDHMTHIRVQTMLNDFMTNDAVIKGYDPQEVLDTYNELAQLSPNVADQPTLMRGLLRRSLSQGHVEPFEAGQLASTAKVVADTNKPGRNLLTAMTQSPSGAYLPQSTGDTSPISRFNSAFSSVAPPLPPVASSILPTVDRLAGVAPKPDSKKTK